MKSFFENNVVKIIGIVLLSAFLIGMVSSFLYKTDKKDDITVIAPDDPIYDVLTHNGGVYYNSTHFGTRYSFDDMLDYSKFDFYPSNEQSIFDHFTVEDGFLKIHSIDGSRRSITMPGVSVPASSDTNIVEEILEFDIMYGGLSYGLENDASFMIVLDYGSYKTGLSLSMVEGHYGLCIPDEEYTDFFNGSSVVVYNGEWNNFRFVYSLVNEKIVFKMYVNNVFAGEFETYQTESSVGEYNSVSFTIDTPTGNFVCFDNIYLGYRVVSN